MLQADDEAQLACCLLLLTPPPPEMRNNAKPGTEAPFYNFLSFSCSQYSSIRRQTSVNIFRLI